MLQKLSLLKSKKKSSAPIMGVDVGGTGIKAAIVDVDSGTLLTDRVRLDTPQPATPEAVAETIAKLVKEFDWKGKIGCGFPSVVQHGVAKTAANIDPSWIGVNAEQLFTEICGCPTVLVNDADAAGLAEVAFGEGKDQEGVVLLLTIGTGVGSALFYNGVLIPNTEFGHLYYKDMVAERYVSDSARKRFELDWEQWAKRFTQFLKHLERTINPDLIIVGGGVSKKPEKFRHMVQIDTPIRLAKLENNAGIIGAALAARE